MEAAQVDSGLCGGESRSYMTVEIDEDFTNELLLRKAPIHCGPRKIIPTARQLDILRRLVESKVARKDEMARALGVSVGTMRRWMDEINATN